MLPGAASIRLPSISERLAIRSLALVLCLLSGCASALPGFDGGGTTPARRTDVLIGGAARIPLGGDEAITAGDALAGGLVPAAAVRHGIRRGLDLGVFGSGTDGALSLRKEHVFQEDSTRKVLLFGGRIYGGAIVRRDDGDDRGRRLGLELPLLYALDVGGLYEGFFGLRAALEHARVDGADGDKRGAVFRVGPSLGFGLGLRRVHGALELGMGVEARSGSLGREDGRVGGYLLPAFALRIRP